MCVHVCIYVYTYVYMCMYKLFPNSAETHPGLKSYIVPLSFNFVLALLMLPTSFQELLRGAGLFRGQAALAHGGSCPNGTPLLSLCQQLSQRMTHSLPQELLR